MSVLKPKLLAAAGRTCRRFLIPKRDNRAVPKIRLHKGLSHKQVVGCTVRAHSSNGAIFRTVGASGVVKGARLQKLRCVGVAQRVAAPWATSACEIVADTDAETESGLSEA